MSHNNNHIISKLNTMKRKNYEQNEVCLSDGNTGKGDEAMSEKRNEHERA
jgi:hypothetical protein